MKQFAVSRRLRSLGASSIVAVAVVGFAAAPAVAGTQHVARSVHAQHSSRQGPRMNHRMRPGPRMNLRVHRTRTGPRMNTAIRAPRMNTAIRAPRMNTAIRAPRMN
jgi:hypothetical protein